MTKKVFLIGLILLCGSLCLWSASSSPWDGTGWNTSAPDIDEPYGKSYLEIQDLRKGIAIRLNKEHETLATSSVGGVHKQGSARAFFQDAAPTTQIDGTAWDSGDRGSFWFDTNASPDNLFYVLTDHASTGTWTLISTSLIAETVAASHTWASAQTFSGLITANNGVTLGAGDDLIGSSTSDITINTNKFTVAGATGNTAVAGTLTVTGVSTFTAGITANGGVTLGAGDDLIGSSTSDITINTNKFTVAGATGNTTVGGTLSVTGTSTVAAVTASGLITANGGVTLGAGDDLIGSSTSNITINTDKFTVAGATGNTVVGGTFSVTGLITANGGVTLGAGDDLIGSPTSDITINTNKFTVAGATGNTAVGGTLAVTGVATLGDSSQMATNAAPTADVDLVNKKYVDDQKDPSYSGGESHTFDGGLIIKRGLNTTYTGDITAGTKGATVTFGVAFPTSCLTVMCTIRDNNVARIVVSTKTIGTTSFSFLLDEVLAGTEDMQGVDWIAIGY